MSVTTGVPMWPMFLLTMFLHEARPQCLIIHSNGCKNSRKHLHMTSVLLSKVGHIQGGMAAAVPFLERRNLGSKHRKEFWDEVWQDGIQLFGVPWYTHQYGSLLNTMFKGSTKFTINYWLLNSTSKASFWEQEVTTLHSSKVFLRNCSIENLFPAPSVASLENKGLKFFMSPGALVRNQGTENNIFKRYTFLFHVCVCCACVCICAPHVCRCTQRLKKTLTTLRTGVTLQAVVTCQMWALWTEPRSLWKSSKGFKYLKDIFFIIPQILEKTRLFWSCSMVLQWMKMAWCDMVYSASIQRWPIGLFPIFCYNH